MTIHILIADDHAIVRKGLGQIILENFPAADIQEAGSVEQMMELLQKNQVDLVISDISMPGQNGIEGMVKIRQLFPDLPVLIVSMHPEDQYALRVIKAGGSGYLNKETVHEELVNAIETVLQGRKFITAAVAERMIENIHKKEKQQDHEQLSDREFDVFKLLATGRSISEIAAELNLSATTISTYRARILTKMHMKSNAEMTRYALSKSLI